MHADPELSKEVFGDEKDAMTVSKLVAAKWRAMTKEEKQVGHLFAEFSLSLS